MDPATYDMLDPKYEADEAMAEADYLAFVEWLEHKTIEEFRAAGRDLPAQRQVLCRYYKRGYAANLTPSELIDFLGVDSPSILETAGYSDDEIDSIMNASDSLTEEEILAAEDSE